MLAGRTVQRLRQACGGAVQLPGDPGYDAARRAWNPAGDQRPAAVAYPADASEVAAVLRIAASGGLRVAPQATGHHGGALGDLDGAVLLRLAGLRGLSVDPDRRRARVAAGMLTRDLVEAAAGYGLAALHPASPDVGVIGHCMAGGLSWYARGRGLAASSVVAADLVLPGGRCVRADAGREPDLLWAMRGGGGGVGVAVAVELQLFRLPAVVAGRMVWDRCRPAEIVERWGAWCTSAPESVTTTLRVLPDPGVVVVDGAVMGGRAAGERVLAPLRAMAPARDSFRQRALPDLLRLHPVRAAPYPMVTGTALLAGWSAPAGQVLADAVGRTGGGLAVVELRQLGGALARPATGGGALPRLDGDMALVVAAPLGAAGRDAAVARVARVIGAMRPWDTGRRYPGFSARAREAATAYPPATLARLRELRGRLDPGGLLVAAQAAIPEAE